MFKMGCSMAKKILAIDKQSSHLDHGASSSSGSSKKDKQHQQESHFSASGGAASNANQGGAAKGKTNTDELGDFSKLEQDPRIPLNIRQIFKITKSWKAIARTMSKTGTAMFLNLFEQNQDLFYLFDRFQHLKGKELHESMELREHASTVMATLDHSINSLSDYDNFVTYLHSIGKLHRKVPGFKRAHFWKIEQPFLKAVKQTLDERCNETIEEIYKIAIKLIIETIADGYGEDDDSTSPNEKKDPGSAGGSNNKNSSNNNSGNNGNDGNDGNDENSRGLSGSNSNTRSKGNSGNTNKFGGQQATSRNNRVTLGESQLEEASGFLNVFHYKTRGTESASSPSSLVQPILNWNQRVRRNQAKTGKTPPSTTRSCMQNDNVSSNVRVLNLHKQNLISKVNLKLNEDNDDDDDENNKQSIETQEQATTSESQENESEMARPANCLSRSRNNDRQDASAYMLKQLFNDERLKEILFVLKELLSTVMAKSRRESKNVGAMETGGLEKEVNEFTAEPQLTDDERNSSSFSFSSFSSSSSSSARFSEADCNYLAEKDTNVNEMELDADKEAAGKQVGKCLLANLEKDNKENCCKYRGKFNKNNSTDNSLQINK